jgi:hypothetical protein
VEHWFPGVKLRCVPNRKRHTLAAPHRMVESLCSYRKRNS